MVSLLSMIYCLYGPDSLRRGRKLNELTYAYKKKYEAPDILDLDFNEDPDSFIRARDFLNQPSLFVSAKVLVVRNSDITSDEKEWARVLKQELKSEKTFVFLSEGKAPKKTFSFLLKDPVFSQEFPEPSLRDLKVFIQKEAAELQVKFDSRALDFFCEQIFRRAEGRAWHARRELEKATLLSKGSTVSENTLREILYIEEEKRVFESARKILFERALPKTISELEALNFRKYSGAYVFNSLSYQARGADAVSLARYDEMIKSGKLEYEEALLDFVLARSV